MNSSNYSYPPTGYSSPYSSTPSSVRSQRPRFAYSGPPLYPRPRSSASKPNPNSFCDSMINNYGTSPSRIDTTFNSENNSFNDSYKNNSGSSYYTANDSFYSDQQCGDSPLHNKSLMRGDPSLMHDGSFMYKDNMMRGDNSIVQGDLQKSGILPKPPSQFGQMKFPYNNSFGANTGEYKGGDFQNRKVPPPFGQNNKASFSARKFGKAKRRTDSKPGVWRCEQCSLDFTSQVPYDMHLRGAKHAKKLKAKQALTIVQSQTVIAPDGTQTFYCEMCNVTANSSLQFQTHLEGNKHKNKLHPKEPKVEPKDGAKEETKRDITEPVDGKTNGSLIRSAPADFGEPQPTKLTKLACDTCNITVNSDLQLQQHLNSKKHQNKLEGKPAKERKNKAEKESLESDTVTTNTDTNQAPADSNQDSADSNQTSCEASKMVVGVKTLASSFVQGETLK